MVTAKAKRPKKPKDKRLLFQRVCEETVDYLGRVRTTRIDVDRYLRYGHGLPDGHVAYFAIVKLSALEAEPLVEWSMETRQWESLVPGWIFDDETLLWSEVPVHLPSELDPAGVECGVPQMPVQGLPARPEAEAVVSTARRRYRRFAGRTGRLQPDLRPTEPEVEVAPTFQGVLDAHDDAVMAAVRAMAAEGGEGFQVAARAHLGAERKFRRMLRRYVGRT